MFRNRLHATVAVSTGKREAPAAARLLFQIDDPDGTRPKVVIHPLLVRNLFPIGGHLGPQVVPDIIGQGAPIRSVPADGEEIGAILPHVCGEDDALAVRRPTRHPAGPEDLQVRSLGGADEEKLVFKEHHPIAIRRKRAPFRLERNDGPDGSVREIEGPKLVSIVPDREAVALFAFCSSFEYRMIP